MKKQYICPVVDVCEIEASQMMASSLTGKKGEETILPSGGTISSGEADSKASAFSIDCDDDFSIE